MPKRWVTLVCAAIVFVALASGVRAMVARTTTASAAACVRPDAVGCKAGIELPPAATGVLGLAIVLGGGIGLAEWRTKKKTPQSTPQSREGNRR